MTPDLPEWPSTAAGGGPPVTYRVVSPSGGDDTANIKAAIAAVVAAGQANGTNYGEVWFAAGLYVIGGALDNTQSGNAQIPLPLIPSTGQKFTLVLRGMADSNAKPHWQSTVVPRSGATLLTSLNSAAGANGPASVIGGPTTALLGTTDGGFSNMLVVVDGISVVCTYSNPVHVAMYLYCLLEANVKSFSANANVAGAGEAVPSGGGTGLVMPGVGNNDYCEIGSYYGTGYQSGLAFSEHTHGSRVHIAVCQSGIVAQDAYPDVARFDYLSTECCQYHINGVNAGGNVRLDIGTWDTEDSAVIPTIYHLQDPGGALHGVANFHRNSASAGGSPDGLVGSDLPPVWNAPGYTFKMTQLGTTRGPQTPPAVPASTVAFPRIYRDAVYTFSGGTVSAISVGGTVQGVTTGVVFVPSGASIAVTYTVAPTLQSLTLL